MANRKTRVLVLCGGKSAEHEVSLQSAKNVVEAMNKDKYEITQVVIDKQGNWQQDALRATDVVFPVLHGTFGEDGTIQGMLKLADIPFVGASVLGSAVGMDKDVQKRLLRDANISVANFVTLNNSNEMSYEAVVSKIGAPFFIKPANLGSSVGVHKVKSKEQFQEAIQDAFSYDRKVLAEEFVAGREIECAVLGNEEPIASVPGEILPRHEFYSYEAKYIDENGAKLEIPARVSEATAAHIQKLAIDAFKVLSCEGMGRVDFFLKENGEVYLNEINTIPGFTKISMYPKLWEASGLSHEKLVDELIRLAIERFNKEQKLKTSFA